MIIPGSVRIRVTHYEDEVMTVRCGQCSSEFEVYTFNRTTRCKLCGRVCRFDQAVTGAPNVVPIRRRA